MENKSIMWDYIAEEPEALDRLIKLNQTFECSAETGAALDAIYFVAHGSSYNAATAVSTFLARTAKLRVYIYTPANFLDHIQVLRQEDEKRTLVVAISQTGTSSGVLEALRMAKRLRLNTLGVTDHRDSPLALEADHTLFLACGEENSNAKTKGYMATLVILLLLTLDLGRVRGELNETTEKEIRQELWEQIAQFKQVSAQVLEWCERTMFGSKLCALYVLGYDMNFGTALEGQLKLMETMCIPSMFNDLGEFSHGMHRAIDRTSTIVLLRTPHSLQGLCEDTFQYLRKLSKEVLLLDATGDAPEGSGRLRLPVYPMTQSLLLMTVAIQVLSVYAPEHIGLDPNRKANDGFTAVAHTRIG